MTNYILFFFSLNYSRNFITWWTCCFLKSFFPQFFLLHSANKLNVIVSAKLCLVVGNDEHVILCNFGDRSTTGFEVIKGTPPKPPSVAGKPGLNRAAYKFSFAARNHREIRRNRIKPGTKKPCSSEWTVEMTRRTYTYTDHFVLTISYCLLSTTKLARFSSLPRIFRATHLYFPASSSRTLLICSRPSEETFVRLLGNTPPTRDQASCGTGFPETEHSKTAVLLSFTVRWEDETVTFGAEMDSPGSPFIPRIPGEPISPFTPFSPLIPGGPIIPCFPLLPGCPIIPFLPLLPWFPLSPLGPSLPGGPVSPRWQTFQVPVFWHIFLKLEVTTSSKTCFMLNDVLNGWLFVMCRATLRSFSLVLSSLCLGFFGGIEFPMANGGKN